MKADELGKAGNNAVLVSLGMMLGDPKRNTMEGGRDYVTVMKPDGSTGIEYLERGELPARAKGKIEVHDKQSFIEAVNRFGVINKAASSAGVVVYACLSPAQLIGVLNDHISGKSGDQTQGGGSSAGWRDHLVQFGMAFSTEYNLWVKSDGKPMDQMDFAHFIDENMPDFITPSGADMLQLATNFKSARDVRFDSKIKMQGGDVQLSYHDVENGGAGAAHSASMPETIKIAIPVWHGLGQKKYEFEAKLRYRVSEGTLQLHYKLIRPQKVVDQAFQDVVDEVKAGCKDVPLLFGKP